MSIIHLRIFLVRRVLVSLMLLALTAPVYAENATLSWNPNTESNLAGYKIHFGQASRAYTTTVNVGMQTSYVVTGLNPGTYYFSVTAYNTTGGESSFSNEGTKVISSTGGPAPAPNPAGTISVNFQPAGTSVPTGFLPDDGSLFNSSLGYGWESPVETRERGINTDRRLDTFAFSQAPATWKYTIPNGNYLVSLASGDPEWNQGPHRVEVEGIRVINDTPTTVNNYVSVVDFPISVTDGQLTIKIGGTPGNTMVNYIVIKASGSAPVLSRCDCSSDGLTNALDLQVLVNAILAGNSSSSYDINGNGNVDVLDLQVLGNVVLGTAVCP